MVIYTDLARRARGLSHPVAKRTALWTAAQSLRIEAARGTSHQSLAALSCSGPHLLVAHSPKERATKVAIATRATEESSRRERERGSVSLAATLGFSSPTPGLVSARSVDTISAADAAQ